MEVLYRAVCKVAMRKNLTPFEIPVVPEGADEDTAADIADQIDKAKSENEVIEKENAKINKLKTKIVIQKASEDYYDIEQEKALVKISNFRDAAM